MGNSKEQGKEKITEEDLGTLSGGHDEDLGRIRQAQMECSNCGWRETREGYYPYVCECPKCGKMEFRDKFYPH